MKIMYQYYQHLFLNLCSENHVAIGQMKTVIFQENDNLQVIDFLAKLYVIRFGCVTLVMF